MPFPEPTHGLVIRYSYLWRDEHLKGQEEGIKDRPCVIILVVTNENADQTVTVLPITRTPPHQSDDVIEIPADTKRRLGLDDERSWVVQSLHLAGTRFAPGAVRRSEQCRLWSFAGGPIRADTNQLHR